MNFETGLREALIKNGLPYYGSFSFEFGKYHCFNSDGICHKKCCRYRIFEGFLGAHLRCWRRDIDIIWWYKDKNDLTQSEIRRFNKERNDLLDLKIKERYEAILQAREEWFKSDELDSKHEYILKKKIIPCYARQYKNSILLPIYNENGEMISNQKIYPDSEKRFAKGASYAGGMLFLSEYPTPTIMIAEGWATACSLREITTSAMCVAFNDSNMMRVAVSVKKLFPKSSIVICGDRGESGIKYAHKAALLVGGISIIPAFDDKHSQYSDFNDIVSLYGKEELDRQLSYLKEGV